MKKILSLMLSVIMLFSVTAGLDFTASAEEPTTTTLTISSRIDGATAEDKIIYELYVNDDFYTGFGKIAGSDEPIYIEGFLEAPATDVILIDIPYGATYEIVRGNYDKPGYMPIDYDIVSGVANKYKYFEKYTLNGTAQADELTEKEFNEKTANGTKLSTVYYYDAQNKARLNPSEVVAKTAYTYVLSENLTSEQKAEIGYKKGTEISYPVKLDISTQFTSGIVTSYYTVSISLKVGNLEYKRDYQTLASRDVTTAKNNAITSIANNVRTYAITAATAITNEKDTSLYFLGSLNSMLPTIKDLSTDSSEKKSISKTTTAIEAITYDKLDVNYEKQLNRSGETAIFEGRLVKKHAHNFVKDKVVEPTCAEKGYTVYTCDFENCIETEKREPTDINPKNHSFTNYVVNNDAVLRTCGKDGVSASKTAKCDRCDATHTIKGEVQPATGRHIASPTPKTENKKNATCAKEGSYDEVTYCLICENELSRTKKTTDKVAHKWNNGVVTKKPTCTKAGTKTYTCSVCKATKTQTLNATGHKFDEGKVTAKPTCKKVGTKTYTCSVCKATKTENISAPGHKFDGGKVTKKPTTKKFGEMTYTCTVCKYKRTSSIQKLQGVSISKLTPAKKSFKVSWKKVSSATGYEIQYSTNSKFKKAKTVNVKKFTTTSTTVKKLKAKKKYYVRIRTYKVMNGTKCTTPWSKVKTVTTKK